jgi:phosphoglycolate phosphatase
MLPRLLEIYGAAVLTHSTPFDGIERVLQHIEDHGRPWGIVTNKPEYLARAVVQGMGWEQRCAVLVGGDTLSVKKPDPAPLSYACDQLRVAPARCVYIGDDRRDVEAPQALGMKAVVALWGYREEDDDPKSWAGDAYVETPVQLLLPGMLSPRA